MLMALKLKFPHLGYMANPAAETGMIPVRVSVPRTLLVPTQTQAQNWVARGPKGHSCAIRQGRDGWGQEHGHGRSWGLAPEVVPKILIGRLRTPTVD